MFRITPPCRFPWLGFPNEDPSMLSLLKVETFSGRFSINTDGRVDDDAANAEAFINKASFKVNDITNESLNLQYKVYYARILDLKRKFLETVLRYFDISQMEKRLIGDE
uniref:PSMD12/CSN4-like N-terminal domain-containing protein n=1 Tax=Solanum lycopersicum TaxID=4081 RepID=A0A3Q7G7A5_SOLLC